MCGIAGIIRRDQVFTKEVEEMTNRLQHRGPDGGGVKVFQNVGIGHRRLSIIDLSTGTQPLSNENETIWITFNGEIYNYLDLRKQLLAKGHVFKTNSDTEVVVHGYEEWGYEVLKKLRGMFAFTIIDLNKKNAFVARDHFGIKPLLYFKTQHTFAFSSEMSAFYSLPEFEPEINHRAIDQYLWLQYIAAPNTAFNNVYKLKPAHYLVVDFKSNISEQISYWDLNFIPNNKKTENEWLEELDGVLKESVKLHMISDVPLGGFLSGGVDSSLVVGYMAKVSNKSIQTFSIGFEEKEYDETHYANEVAKKYNTAHHVEIVHSDALTLLPELVRHYGEPFGDSSALPTYYVSQLAKKHVTVALSGDGGDEAFVGYETYKKWYLNQPYNYRKGVKKTFYNQLNTLFPTRFPKGNTTAIWMSYMEYLNSDSRSQLWKTDYHHVINKEVEAFENAFRKNKNYSLINKAQYTDLKTYLPFDILTKVDVASMMHSLEVRTPLIDKAVWEFAATIPEKFNFTSKEGEFSGKKLLRKLLAKDFDQNFVYRKKQGFGVPVSKWFSNTGTYNKQLKDKLLSDGNELSQLFDFNYIEKLIEGNNSGAVWLLLFLEEWMLQVKQHVRESKKL